MVVAGDYLAERALRDGSCRERLRRLDFLGLAALGAHRLDDAARDRAEADALEAGECATASLRLNGETVRLGLLRRGRGSVATLRANIDRLAAGGVASHAVYLDYLRASAALLEDRARGTAQLDAVIERADANPRRAFAAVARASSFDLLVESAARARDATALAALFERRLGLVDPPRCALAIAQPDSLVALAYDAAGQVTLDEREVPTGLRALAPELVVSTTLRARLAGCARIDVLTWGPYLGAARLFSDQAWRYALRGTADAPAHAGHALVVSDAEPPAELHLARLASFPAPPGATALRGTQATPSRVLAALADADIAVIVAHGVTDANEPSAANLVLSPDEHGDYLLTAAAVSATRLSAAPVVVLAGCDAGRVQVSAEPWSLATAFLGAGARAVIAPTEPIPDDGANEIFQSLVARLRAGEDPADAVAMERRAHGATAPWLASVVVFQQREERPHMPDPKKPTGENCHPHPPRWPEVATVVIVPSDTNKPHTHKGIVFDGHDAVHVSCLKKRDIPEYRRWAAATFANVQILNVAPRGVVIQCPPSGGIPLGPYLKEMRAHARAWFTPIKLRG